MVPSRFLTSLILIPLLITANEARTQTADIDRGCIPLSVEFDAPDLNAYYWDFKDGASSELRSPEHTFIQAGTFNVELYEGVGGDLIGELTIRVYRKPEVNFIGDPTSGCAPLEVMFEADIDADPGIDILSYQWVFGDGLSSDSVAPVHTYTSNGTFAVSLQLETDPAQCRVTELVPDYVTVSSAVSFFRLDRYSWCDAPAMFEITDVVPFQDGYKYEWDFGNGQTSSAYDPGEINYEQSGSYTITLTVTDQSGCSAIHTRQVSVGRVEILMNVPDTVCPMVESLFENESGTAFTFWDFGPTATPSVSNSSSVEVRFDQPGPVTVSLTTYSSADCQSDTTFTVIVDEAIPDFNVSPKVSCFRNLDIQVQAVSAEMAQYIWNYTLDGGPVETISYSEPERDSFHIYLLDTIQYTLIAETHAGCRDTQTNYWIHRIPDAYFVANRTRGCAPLTVNFFDRSQSIQPITRWSWDYGDGQSEEFNSSTDPVHVFEEPGEYYVRMNIENSDGCRDTAFGMWIYVGEPIEPHYELDKTEICLGDSVSIEITNEDPRIDAWHFNTDDFRFDQCWISPTATHAFVTEPGTFEATATIEYNGCYETSDPTTITVNGAKAEMTYMINCDAPRVVMLWNESRNGDRINWTLPPLDSSSLDSLVWTFDDTGTYTIVLEAEEEGTGCPVSYDSAEVHIVDLQAGFAMDSLLCIGQEYVLDASSSIEVDTNCSQGYLWLLPNNRPREIDYDTINHIFTDSGPQTVGLVVESINGCRDTMTKIVEVFDMDLSFSPDRNNICDPATVVFTDMSSSDTTIVSYDWSFGDQGKVVEATFENFEVGQGINITLTATDAIGCMESVTRQLSTYVPESSIEFDNGPNICAGTAVNFTAEDFTSQGSFLNFDWDFGTLGSSQSQSPALQFNDAGSFPVLLTYVEDATGCRGSDTVEFNVVVPPEANFISNFDTLSPICHPEVGVFTNTSEIDGPVSYFWSMDNGFNTLVENPVAGFGKGSFEVRLIVSSFYGCADTAYANYTLVGPEGTFMASDDVICKDDEITFELLDTVDVGSFLWDFGDGVRVEDVDPVTHVYGFNPPGGQTLVTLVLESGETGCTIEDSMSIEITELIADFQAFDSIQYCRGQIAFMDQSIGANSWNWDFGNGTVSTDQNPTALFGSPGLYAVTLNASDTENGCEDSFTDEIEVSFEEFIFMPNVFTPNGDARNDYFTPVVLPGYEQYVEVRQFKIYNRWGNLVYDNEQPDFGWDGTDHGADAPATVYAYAIEIEILECTTMTFQGNVTLLR